MIVGPRPAKSSEYDELMRLLERSYRVPREHFQEDYPHIWRPDTINMKDRFIIKEKGRIVSHVGLIPFEIISDDKFIKVAGIGGVASDPDCRGKGYMGTLLKFAVKEMERRKYPISILWGDRFRYGNFGWEQSNLTLYTEFTARDIEKWKPAKSLKIKKYCGSKTDLQIIMKIHESEPLRVYRTKAVYKALMGRPRQETWMANAGKGWGYMTISEKEGKKIIGERGGEPRAVMGLVPQIIRRIGFEPIKIAQSNRITLLTEVLLRTCSFCYLEAQAMIKIIDLDATLEAFGVDTAGIRFKMTADSEDRFEPLKPISGREVRLPQTAMARMLFTDAVKNRYFRIDTDLAVKLGSLFPLEFYAWPIENI